jgi:glycosyltransferase involved in cell wall biosynthesis
MARPKKFDVILTCNYSPWSRYKGGGQKSVHMLACELAASGKSVCVVFSKAPWESIDVPPRLPYHVRWALFIGIRPGISSPLRFLNGLPFLLKVRSISSPRTMVIGNGDEASLLGIIASKSRFIFSSRNTYDAFLQGRDWSHLLTWIKVFFREPRNVAVAMAALGADSVACTSGFSNEQLQKCFRLERNDIRVIHNGVDPAFFECRFRENRQTGILFFGRLTYNKGAHLALEAYVRLAPAVRRIHPLVFVGEGPLKSQLVRNAKAAGVEDDVHFAGWKQPHELARMIVSHRLAFLPSLEESFGNAIIETLATGQRLVTNRVCSIPELVGPYATLVRPDDIDGMASAIMRELTVRRTEEEIDSQREYFQNRFSWQACGRNYMSMDQV